MSHDCIIRKPALATLCLCFTVSSASATCFRGINLAGAEFGDLGGAYEQSYIYPSKQTIHYFADKGLNTIRLPFRWERLQPVLGSDLDENELNRIRATVAEAASLHLNIILDVHNYAGFAGDMIGSRTVPIADFADLWRRLAEEFGNQPDITFGLMNEPTGIKTETWLQAANAAIAAIRETGAKNLVLVPGTSWTGAHSWFSNTDDGNNASVMKGVIDPVHHYAYEFHQYLDSNFSGTHETCPRAEDAVRALKDVTQWLQDNNARGFLGEFGGSDQESCMAGLTAMVSFMNTNKDIWTGWTYWAGGDWWPPTEPLNIQPVGGKDKAQLSTLLGAGLADDDCGM